jgi:hypothetical protein
MAKKVWTIHVTGPIIRLRSDGSPVRVPEGVYTMTEGDPRQYDVSRDGGVRFVLWLTGLFLYVVG